MEDIELLSVGLLFAIALSLTELRLTMPKRVAAGLGVVLLTAVMLYVLQVSVTANAVDFLQADVGSFLGVGLIDTWLKQARQSN